MKSSQQIYCFGKQDDIAFSENEWQHCNLCRIYKSCSKKTFKTIKKAMEENQ